MFDPDDDTSQRKRRFDEDGFLSLSDFLTAPEVAEVNERTDAFIETAVPHLPSELVYYEDRADPTTLKQVQLLQDHDPYFHSLLFRSRFEDLARELLGENVVGKNL